MQTICSILSVCGDMLLQMVDDYNLILDRGMWIKPKTVRFNPGHVGLTQDRWV